MTRAPRQDPPRPAPDRNTPDRDAPGAAAPPPYVVSRRTREAIEALGADDRPAPPARPRVGVVADAESLRVFARYCFHSGYEVVVADDVSALAREAEGRPLRLLCIDLYTLDHQSEADLAVLAGTFAGVPLLVLAQERRRAQSVAARAGRPCTVLTLPAGLDDIRRTAAALVHAGPPPAE